MGKIIEKQQICEMIKAIDQCLSGCRTLTDTYRLLDKGNDDLDFLGEDWSENFYVFEDIQWNICHSHYVDDMGVYLFGGICTTEEDANVREYLVPMREILIKIKDSIEEHFCPSCGADLSDSYVWSTTEESNDLCYCCGLKFDRHPPLLQEVKAARDRWLQHPEYWKEPAAKPENWKIEDQMGNIPGSYL